MITAYLIDVIREIWPELIFVSVFVALQYFVALNMCLRQGHIVVGIKLFNVCSILIASCIGYMLAFDVKYFEVVIVVFIVTEIFHYKINKAYKLRE